MKETAARSEFRENQNRLIINVYGKNKIVFFRGADATTFSVADVASGRQVEQQI
jgi:hypothetical protein